MMSDARGTKIERDDLMYRIDVAKERKRKARREDKEPMTEGKGEIF